ncbi:hypothetical protein F5B21DRAFT_528237 [Xylaria acuta]|nr:hypothetical protein F5B21DRAFT_528237 [Xylaria acuta]
MRSGDSNVSRRLEQNYTHYQNGLEFSTWPEDIYLFGATSDLNFFVGPTTGMRLTPSVLLPITAAIIYEHGSGHDAMPRLAGEVESTNLSVVGITNASSVPSGSREYCTTHCPRLYRPAAMSGSLPSQPLLPSSPPRPPPGVTEPSRKHKCTKCPDNFTHNKDLVRHMNTVHAAGNEEVYRCRCGKDNVRKDNHCRHARACKKERRHSYYTCKCLVACAEKEEHLRHVKDCRYGFGHIGRPCVASGPQVCSVLATKALSWEITS